ncbi:MAG: DNA polymerase III subunit gamma/tau, partial [Endozoicomonas sp.]
MSYQVLARKWRPRSFKELVGQTHVLQALVNALDQDRLHHAYLFTGTRGVGKTTIARIFAKCLNCEAGVSSTPCGECSACREIDDGRFVDLIEVDAASRTKVEDTRELLDNVQYAPTRGRYKVYLIDEVHMLSAHSFNALLKTLEEPPPHVKFLLATTDPQKLPITILSRCLQFSLKNMSPERIVGHLEHVLEQEELPFEVAALWQLARSADGSMRDALSLTDQAIAFGNGRVTESEVGAMLGTIDQGRVMKIVSTLASGNAADVLGAVAGLADYSPDYMAVLDDLLAVLHRVAIGQAVPDAVDNSQGDRDQVIELAAAMTAEDVQLYYQTGLIGKKDLPLAPEPRSGFEMALLRMLAFRPDAAPVSAHVLQDGGSVAGGSTVQDDGESVQEPEPEPEGSPPPVTASVAASVLENERVASDGVHPVGDSADEIAGAVEDAGPIKTVESSPESSPESLPVSREFEEGGRSERAVDAFEPPVMSEPEAGGSPDHSAEPLPPPVEAIPL